jgi:transcriptional regulator GlxA family with amidase domain
MLPASISSAFGTTVRGVRIAIAAFDGVEELDFAGPWEVLAFWAREVAATDVEVFSVGPSADAVRAAKGMRVLPDRSWLEVAADSARIDVLLMPGGRGTRALIRDDDMLDRLRALAASGTLMTSVCTGALVLAAAGLLRGRPATTHHENLAELAAADPSIEVRGGERFVDDGDVITSAGVSAGIDMALHLVRRLDGADAARAVRRGIQYDPQPPI